MWQKLIGVAAIAGAFAIDENIGSSVDDTARAVLVAGGIEMLQIFDGGKNDGAWGDVEGYLCVFLEMPEFCPTE